MPYVISSAMWLTTRQRRDGDAVVSSGGLGRITLVLGRGYSESDPSAAIYFLKTSGDETNLNEVYSS